MKVKSTSARKSVLKRRIVVGLVTVVAIIVVVGSVYAAVKYSPADKAKPVYGTGTNISSNLDHDGNQYGVGGSSNGGTNKTPDEEQEEDENKVSRPNPNKPMER